MNEGKKYGVAKATPFPLESVNRRFEYVKYYTKVFEDLQTKSTTITAIKSTFLLGVFLQCPKEFAKGTYRTTYEQLYRRFKTLCGKSCKSTAFTYLQESLGLLQSEGYISIHKKSVGGGRCVMQVKQEKFFYTDKGYIRIEGFNSPELASLSLLERLVYFLKKHNSSYYTTETIANFLNKRKKEIEKILCKIPYN